MITRKWKWLEIFNLAFKDDSWLWGIIKMFQKKYESVIYHKPNMGSNYAGRKCTVHRREQLHVRINKLNARVLLIHSNHNYTGAWITGQPIGHIAYIFHLCLNTNASPKAQYEMMFFHSILLFLPHFYPSCMCV